MATGPEAGVTDEDLAPPAAATKATEAIELNFRDCTQAYGPSLFMVILVAVGFCVLGMVLLEVVGGKPNKRRRQPYATWGQTSKAV